MKYKILNPVDPTLSVQEQILKNRGIPLKEQRHFLECDMEDVFPPELLGESELQEAAELLLGTVQAQKEIGVIVDCDCDGYTAAAIMLNYLNTFARYDARSLATYFIHDSKQHGLEDLIDEIKDTSIELLICPDSCTNDHLLLHEVRNFTGNKSIILDHHLLEQEKVSEDAITINSQLNNYPNKFLCGAGVVYKFCKYLDNFRKVGYADNFLDLTALGNCGDMMNYTELETKALIQEGFKPKNVLNPFIYTIWEKNKFKIGDNITYMGAAFYIVPFVNAMTRSGELDEKNLLFQSMVDYYAFDNIPSTKRGHKPGDTEVLCEAAVRIAGNVKRRQTKDEEKGIALIEKRVKEMDMLKHQVLIFILDGNDVRPEIRGLLANKMANKYQRPCLMLTRSDKGGVPYYGGSMRGYELTGITNFKKDCDDSGLCDLTVGHANAAGCYVHGEDVITNLLEYFDEKYKDIDNSEPVYLVDFIWDSKNIKEKDIISIGNLESHWGQNIKESLVAVRNVSINKNNLTMMARNTLKINLGSVNAIKFHCSEELYEELQAGRRWTIIGKPNKNEWQGNISGQILIEDLQKQQEGFDWGF